MSDNTCGKMVEGGGTIMAYPCDLYAGHDGPCAAEEVRVSGVRRHQWLKDRPVPAPAEAQTEPQQDVPPPEVRAEPQEPPAAHRAAQRLREFQGEAQTTAERYTENPTPVPGKPREEPGRADVCPACSEGQVNCWQCVVFTEGEQTCACYQQNSSWHQTYRDDRRSREVPEVKTHHLGDACEGGHHDDPEFSPQLEQERPWDADEDGRCTWQRAGEQCAFDAGHTEPHGTLDERERILAENSGAIFHGGSVIHRDGKEFVFGMVQGSDAHCIITGARVPKLTDAWVRKVSGISGNYGRSVLDEVISRRAVAELYADEKSPEPTKQREGDQRLPEPTDHPVAHEMVKDDLDERLAIGIKRYGQPLQPFNGRNTIQDAYEETLDQAVYLRSMLYAAQRSRDELIEEVRQLITGVDEAPVPFDAGALAMGIVDHLIYAGVIQSSNLR